MKDRAMLPFLLPVAAILCIAAYAGGLGVLFIISGENTAIAVGSFIAFGVPAIAAYIVSRKGQST